MNDKILLAFSGGLDTTYCAVYLSKILNYEVHAVTINTGGFSDKEIEALRDKSQELGFASFECLDVTKTYYEKCLKYLVFGNVLKNNVYPLSVSSERVTQAIAIAEYAVKLDILTIAHGSTGAGNDQVRFDMIFNQLLPQCNIVTPIRDQKLDRQTEIDFLKSHGINFEFQKAEYSVNKGLWGTSIGGKETLTSGQTLPEYAWPGQITEFQPMDLKLIFKNGELSGINDENFDHPVEAIQSLQNIAQTFGIGRDVHVGDTIIGIKGRVAFEAAAPMIIIKAHALLEKHVLTKWQIFWKDQLSSWYGNWMHEGQMLDPVMRDIESFFVNTQQYVSGNVFVTLFPHRFILNGIESKHDLMSDKFGVYGETNNKWTGQDVRGFTKIFGNQTSLFHQINQS